MKTDDLLDELRRECPELYWAYGSVSLMRAANGGEEKFLRELAALKRQWEAAAAERMRERCALICKRLSNQAAEDDGSSDAEAFAAEQACDTAEVQIRALEPEEPTQ